MQASSAIYIIEFNNNVLLYKAMASIKGAIKGRLSY
jgi:hypothetical protein